MAKVIVERPRHGSSLPNKGKGYDRDQAKYAWEDQPKREGMKLRGGSRKSFNEHLAPLRRYLAGQIGRPWDKIFADLCCYLSRDSVVQDHVRDHVYDYVATSVMIQGGKLCHGDGYRIGQPLRTLFYVCPCTGLLRKNRNYHRWHFQPMRLSLHYLYGKSALVRKDGVWHILTIQQFPKHVWAPTVGFTPAPDLECWDAFLRTKLVPQEAERIYGKSIHAVATRRAGKREVRQLVNSYPFTNIVR